MDQTSFNNSLAAQKRRLIGAFGGEVDKRHPKVAVRATALPTEPSKAQVNLTRSVHIEAPALPTVVEIRDHINAGRARTQGKGNAS